MQTNVVRTMPGIFCVQSLSDYLAIAVCVHVCACSGDESSCLLELHTVLEVQPVTMLD